MKIYQAQRTIYRDSIGPVDVYSNYQVQNGFVIGGRVSTSPYYPTTNNQLGYATQVMSILSEGSLYTGRAYCSGISDGLNYGYTVGGSGLLSTEKLSFSTKTHSIDIEAALSATREACAPIYGGDMGYLAAGSTYSDNENYALTNTFGINFSTFVGGLVSGCNCTTGRAVASGLSDGSVYGYVLGGQNATGLLYTTDCLTLSSRTMSALASAALSFNIAWTKGISSSVGAGYVTGGTASGSKYAWKLNYYTRVNSVGDFSLTTNTYLQGSLSDGGQKGYCVGGNTGDSSPIATSQSIDFNTDVCELVSSANLATATYAASSYSEGAY